MIRRILRTLAICLAVGGSLLCFPHWLPWMIAGWILLHAALIWRGMPAVWPLATCVLILLIRLSPHTPAMLLLGGGMLVVAGGRRYFRRGADPHPWTRPAGIAVLVGLWGLMFIEYRAAANSSRSPSLDPNRPIVCIGDSLTQGMIPDRGYPGQLEQLLRVPVINRGVSGISTGPAIGIVQRAMELNPQLVVLELGGHDFLKWHRRSTTKRNLVKMIEICRRNDAEVVLLEIPRGFMIDPYASLEREIAYQYDVQLVDDRWLRQIVLMSPAAPPGMWMKDHQLSDDGIHSNARGSLAIARNVADAIVKLYGPQVLR
ncbi:GDSL-type esterase/lipase family protein [Stieleria tagensis]|uniref:GDSL-type esterase/lipase family protein n=1 Tax=Stieleria tagensis TaxID=2956795 RepID=UPI00209AED59|nr:GDSL-type esterase/lipase family protein [Stieleria tagensis]